MVDPAPVVSSLPSGHRSGVSMTATSLLYDAAISTAVRELLGDAPGGLISTSTSRTQTGARRSLMIAAAMSRMIIIGDLGRSAREVDLGKPQAQHQRRTGRGGR